MREDEVEMRYAKDSHNFNSLPNPNQISGVGEESNSFLYIPFE